MAVLQPGAFQGIYEMLQQRANQERNAPPSTLAVAANAAGKVSGAYAGAKISNKMDAEHEKDLLRFKSGLEDTLTKKKEKYKAQGDGKQLFDQKKVNDYYQSRGLDVKFAPNVGEDGLYLSDKELQDIMNEGQSHVGREKLADSVEQSDPKFAAYIRAFPKEGDEVAKRLFPETNKRSGDSGKRIVKDTERGITYEYDLATKEMTPIAGMKPSGPIKAIDALEKNDRKEAVDVKNKFQNVYKKYRETLDVAGQLEKSISAKNPILDTATRVKMAKLFGDSGNIAIVEQEQYGGSPEIGEQIRNFASRRFEGVTSPENRKYLLEAVRVLKKGVQENVNTETAREKSNLKEVYNFDEDFAHTFLTGEKPRVKVTGPDGKTGTVVKGSKLPEGWKYVEEKK